MNDKDSLTKENKVSAVYVIEQRLSRKHKWHPWVAYTDLEGLERGMRNVREDNGNRVADEMFRTVRYESTNR